MKQLSQTMFLFILGESAIQIMIATGTLVVLTQLLLNKIIAHKTRWLAKKKTRDFEHNMWSIE